MTADQALQRARDRQAVREHNAEVRMRMIRRRAAARAAAKREAQLARRIDRTRTEDDVRELVLVPIDNNRAAMWSDPREQLGL